MMRAVLMSAVVTSTVVLSAVSFFALRVDRAAPRLFWVPWAVIALGAATATLVAYGLK